MSTELLIDHKHGGSPDFRAGMAYAAHMLRTTAGTAHGRTKVAADAAMVPVEPRPCCREAIFCYAEGMAEGLEDEAGLSMAEHEHAAGVAS